MGLCTPAQNKHYSLNDVNQIIINGRVKDVTKDYLLEESIKMPLNSKYTLTNSKLGKGAFGKVLIGEDNKGNKYAIKILKKIKILYGQLLSNEVKIGMKLNHPNILGIKEVYEDKKNISFVMDYIDGGTLFDYIVSSPCGRLDTEITLDIIIQILKALDYLHNELKICHRDIKPENILISFNEDDKPFIKLIDFGFSEEIKKGEKFRGKFGTKKYMPPEIIQRLPYTEKVDMWSTGVLLFNMETGCSPFNNNDGNDILEYQIINADIKFESIINKDIRNLCKSLMERNPNKRIDAKNAFIKAINIQNKLFGNYNNNINELL